MDLEDEVGEVDFPFDPSEWMVVDDFEDESSAEGSKERKEEAVGNNGKETNTASKNQSSVKASEQRKSQGKSPSLKVGTAKSLPVNSVKKPGRTAISASVSDTATAFSEESTSSSSSKLQAKKKVQSKTPSNPATPKTTAVVKRAPQKEVPKQSANQVTESPKGSEEITPGAKSTYESLSKPVKKAETEVNFSLKSEKKIVTRSSLRTAKKAVVKGGAPVTAKPNTPNKTQKKTVATSKTKVLESSKVTPRGKKTVVASKTAKPKSDDELGTEAVGVSKAETKDIDDKSLSTAKTACEVTTQAKGSFGGVSQPVISKNAQTPVLGSKASKDSKGESVSKVSETVRKDESSSLEAESTDLSSVLSLVDGKDNAETGDKDNSSRDKPVTVSGSVSSNDSKDVLEGEKEAETSDVLGGSFTLAQTLSRLVGSDDSPQNPTGLPPKQTTSNTCTDSDNVEMTGPEGEESRDKDDVGQDSLADLMGSVEDSEVDNGVMNYNDMEMEEISDTELPPESGFKKSQDTKSSKDSRSLTPISSDGSDIYLVQDEVTEILPEAGSKRSASRELSVPSEKRARLEQGESQATRSTPMKTVVKADGCSQTLPQPLKEKLVQCMINRDMPSVTVQAGSIDSTEAKIEAQDLAEYVSKDLLNSVASFSSFSQRLSTGTRPAKYGISFGPVHSSDVDKVSFREDTIKKASCYNIHFSEKDTGFVELFFEEQEAFQQMLSQIRRTKIGSRYLVVTYCKVAESTGKCCRVTIVYDQNFSSTAFLTYHKAPFWSKPKTEETLSLHNVPSGIPVEFLKALLPDAINLEDENKSNHSQEDSRILVSLNHRMGSDAIMNLFHKMFVHGQPIVFTKGIVCSKDLPEIKAAMAQRKKRKEEEQSEDREMIGRPRDINGGNSNNQETVEVEDFPLQSLLDEKSAETQHTDRIMKPRPRLADALSDVSDDFSDISDGPEDFLLSDNPARKLPTSTSRSLRPSHSSLPHKREARSSGSRSIEDSRPVRHHHFDRRPDRSEPGRHTHPSRPFRPDRTDRPDHRVEPSQGSRSDRRGSSDLAKRKQMERYPEDTSQELRGERRKPMERAPGITARDLLRSERLALEKKERDQEEWKKRWATVDTDKGDGKIKKRPGTGLPERKVFRRRSASPAREEQRVSPVRLTRKLINLRQSQSPPRRIVQGKGSRASPIVIGDELSGGMWLPPPQAALQARGAAADPAHSRQPSTSKESSVVDRQTVAKFVDQLLNLTQGAPSAAQSAEILCKFLPGLQEKVEEATRDPRGPPNVPPLDKMIPSDFKAAPPPGMPPPQMMPQQRPATGPCPIPPPVAPPLFSQPQAGGNSVARMEALAKQLASDILHHSSSPAEASSWPMPTPVVSMEQLSVPPPVHAPVLSVPPPVGPPMAVPMHPMALHPTQPPPARPPPMGPQQRMAWGPRHNFF